LDKFPGSASLRLDYANFCDIVLNDVDQVERIRQGVQPLKPDN
jgi:hypothetical protein